MFNKFIGGSRYPLDQRIEDKKRGIGRQKYPVVGKLRRRFPMPVAHVKPVWCLTAVMVCLFIYELVVNAKAQGTPFSFKVRFCLLGSRFTKIDKAYSHL
jgi:hypothetical protein